jgi:hypothetical protein
MSNLVQSVGNMVGAGVQWLDSVCSAIDRFIILRAVEYLVNVVVCLFIR